MIEIESLDRIALKVKDIEASADWYERILGLQRIGPSAWNPCSVFLKAGPLGIALIPAATKKPSKIVSGDWIVLDHIALRIPSEKFGVAQKHLSLNGIAFEVERYPASQSILFKDPDGYRLELVSQL